VKIVAISGSLRARSSNSALLRAAATLAPVGMELVFYEELGALPHFNPDLDFEGATPAPAVHRLRETLAAADGVVICSPEYAHGLPGSLKNGLDWIVSSGELTDKPVLLLNAAPAGGEIAQALLTDTLQMMGARVLREASLSAPFLRQRLDPQVTTLADADAREKLKASLEALGASISAG
jgi:chromate reductase